MRSFKKAGKALLCLAVLFVILKLLDMALYPCTYTRNDVHTIATKQRDVILLGTSNGKMNIDPDILLEGTGLTGHNLCAGGQYPVDMYYLAKLAVEKQDPKMIILELDPAYFMMEKEPGNNYLLFYHEFPVSGTKLSYTMDALLGQDFRMLFFPCYEYPLSVELAHIKETFTQKAAGDYSVDRLQNSRQAYHENGYIEKFPVSVENFPAYSPTLFEEEKVVEEDMEYLRKLVSLCRENEIDIAAVSTPLPGGALFRDQAYFDAAWDYFGGFFEENNIPFYNFNREYFDAFSHGDDVFVDYDGHMNGDAARAYSKVLGSIMFNR